MSEDEAALLRMIRANPDDDIPRLVYADWLEEHEGNADCRECGGRGVLYIKPNPVLCSYCRATGGASNGYARRAEFIRVQCENAKNTLGIWRKIRKYCRYFLNGDFS